MMDDLENMLRRLPLRRPSEELDRRILSPPKRIGLRWSVIGGMAAAAIVLVAIGFLHFNRTSLPAPVNLATGVQATAPAAAALEPLRLEQYNSNVKYEGLYQLDDKPWRQYRQQDIRVVRVTDPNTGDAAQAIIPVERVVLVMAEVY